jgi:hypothetical protein
MKCSQCENELPNNAIYCPVCGKKVGALPNYSKIKNTSKSNKCSYLDGSSETSKVTSSSKCSNQIYNKRFRGVIKVILFILLVIFIGSFIGSCSTGGMSSTNNDVTKNYDEAIDLAKQNKWDGVTTKLVTCKDANQKVNVLYNYASAQKSFHNGDGNMAILYLKEISDDYDGELADDIRQFKKKLYPHEDEYKQQVKEKEAEEKRYRDSHLYIGDPESKLEQLFGQPSAVHKTVTGNNEYIQYVFYRKDKTICIYTENGVVTSWQE